MAPRVTLLFFSLVFLYLANTSHSLEKIQAFMHPIYKHKATNLYSIPLSIGTSSPYAIYVLDLNGAAPISLDCAKAANSTSYHSIKCGSTRCSYANPSFTCPTKKKTICRSSDNARLFRDVVPLLYSYNGVYIEDTEKSSNMTLTCKDAAPALKPTSSAFRGTIGLVNTHLSIPSQLSSMYKLPLKMALCLPSIGGRNNGDFWIGKGEYYYLPYREDVSKIFSSTPLITNDKSSDYLINVKYIQIGGKTVPILHGPTKICTLAPYTVLQTSIYKALLTAFTGKTKMVKAPAVKPFGACFRSNGGHGVPVIDLVVSGGAKWKIYGSNSLVKVNKNVVCLGFVDGGVNPKNPIVIGGFQMEDNLVEFDLKASKFSFSSSLLLHNTSCSVERLSPN